MQTVPSLALFGFLIPLNLYLFQVKIVGGIGARTAIVALVLYALLPIIRNTFTGINGVDPAIREAGRGMGMTDRQLLFQVELPLALGVILAGVRVATVICVGTATIAAAIDAGGLGRYIFRGLRMNDNVLILAGAVPAALIAVAADLILGYAERAIRMGNTAGKRFKRIIWASAGAIAVLAIAGVLFFYSGKTGDRIASGVERLYRADHSRGTLGAGHRSEDGLAGGAPLRLGRDPGSHEALVAGEIDTYVEYTGTALLAILKGRPSADPEEVFRRVKSDANRFKLEWMEPLGFNNTFAILVRGEDAQAQQKPSAMRPRSRRNGALALVRISCRGPTAIRVSPRSTAFIFRRYERWICRSLTVPSLKVKSISSPGTRRTA